MAVLEWDRFLNAYVRARKEFLPQEGVLGVGYGSRVVDGHERREELAIIVLVDKTLATDPVLKGKLFRATIEGFPIDVREPRLEAHTDERSGPNETHSDLLMIDWVKVHSMNQNLASARSSSGAPPRTDKVGQVWVIEDDGTLITCAAGVTCIDWIRGYELFRLNWSDDYDFVAMVPDTTSGMPNPGTSWNIPVFNNVVGINYYADPHPNRGDLNYRPYYGTKRLLSHQVLRPPTDRYNRLHEIAHQWGSCVWFRTDAEPWDHYDLIGDDKNHWAQAFDSGFSAMDYDKWFWTQVSVDTFSEDAIPDEKFNYCPLDLYLMGMLAPKEVPRFYYIDNLTYDPTRYLYTGTRVDLELTNIAKAHCWRNPTAAVSQRSFRQAFVVLTSDLDDGKRLAATIDADRIAHTTEFRSATRSRAVLDTYLYSDPYDDIYIRDNATDTGTEPVAGRFWDSPDIWVRNRDDGGPDHQDTIRGRDNYIHVRVWNKGAQDSDESTVNVFRANYACTEFLYPQDWHLDNWLGSEVIGSVPAGGSVVAKIKWDRRMIPPTTWHPCLLAEILPIHRRKKKLRYVWEDRRIAQKNLTILSSPISGAWVTLPFRIGTWSLPARWVRIHIRQTEGGSAPEAILDLSRGHWEDRLRGVPLPEGMRRDAENARSRHLNEFATGGEVIEREGQLVFVISDARRGGAIALPLLEAERRELSLRLNWGHNELTEDTHFEITQSDEQNRIVGGLDLVIRGARGTN